MLSNREELGPECGQVTLLLLGVLAALLAGTLILFGFGQALGARSKHQRAADLAAVSAAQVMRRHYSRLFEAAVFENGEPNPRHLSNDEYLALARRAALRGARRNGVSPAWVSVSFPQAGFAPTRVKVTARGAARLRVGGRRERVAVRASAAAEIAPDLGVAFGQPTHGSGGGYEGPLAYRMGKPMRPDVAAAFDLMAAAARREAGLYLSVNSGFRSDAEQAVLWNANPNPRWVAPPGTSLHRWATELDLGPTAAYDWLWRNHRRFGFIRRYAWEPWHYELPLAAYGSVGVVARQVLIQAAISRCETPSAAIARTCAHSNALLTSSPPSPNSCQRARASRRPRSPPTPPSAAHLSVLEPVQYWAPGVTHATPMTRSAVRHASACSVSVGLWPPVVGKVHEPTSARFGISCAKPNRSTTDCVGSSPMRVPP